jgi:hypothetical protein
LSSSNSAFEKVVFAAKSELKSKFVTTSQTKGFGEEATLRGRSEHVRAQIDWSSVH